MNWDEPVSILCRGEDILRHSVLILSTQCIEASLHGRGRGGGEGGGGN